MANGQPKCVYLDQNVYGHMLDEGNGDWRSSKVGKILVAARAADKGLVWIGPTHVLETMLTTEDRRRRDLARSMLEVVDYKRVWYGYELEVVTEFFDFLAAVSPSCIRTRYFINRATEEQARTWLATLALLAVGAPAEAAAADDVRRLKLQNRLLHARFGADPNGWVDRILSAAKGWQTTRDNVFAELDEMSADEIEAETEQLRASAQKFDKKHFDRLNKERATIAAAYGALDVTAALDSTFSSPMSLDLTVNTFALLADWPAQQAKLGLRSMPKAVIAALNKNQALDANVQVAIIDTAIQAWSQKTPLTASISYEALLLELQRKFNDKDLPTQGIVLDADHAGALRRVNVFYTEDALFGHHARQLAQKVGNLTGGRHCPSVGTTADELATLLEV